MLLNSPFVSSKIETIDFKAFLKGEQPKNTVQPPKLASQLPLLSVIPIHPAAMIDPVFIAIAMGVLLIAMLEKGLAASGNVSIAAFLSMFLKLSFPVAGLTGLWFLLNSLKFLF